MLREPACASLSVRRRSLAPLRPLGFNAVRSACLGRTQGSGGYKVGWQLDAAGASKLKAFANSLRNKGASLMPQVRVKGRDGGKDAKGRKVLAVTSVAAASTPGTTTKAPTPQGTSKAPTPRGTTTTKAPTPRGSTKAPTALLTQETGGYVATTSGSARTRTEQLFAHALLLFVVIMYIIP